MAPPIMQIAKMIMPFASYERIGKEKKPMPTKSKEEIKKELANLL